MLTAGFEYDSSPSPSVYIKIIIIKNNIKYNNNILNFIS